MKLRFAQGCLAIAAALLAVQNSIAAEAGSVLFARGEVTAERQPPVPLVKGDAVMDNDTVATGDGARAQIRLSDGARIAIRPNSRLRIDEYVFQGNTVADGQAVSTSGDRSVATLIKGGFRTITGAIGKNDEEAYEVRTPVGVLGIRGTDYSAVFCNGDCDWVPGFNPNAPIEDGLYLGVTEGAIFFRNEIADIEVEAGRYAFIPLSDRTPTELDAPPPALLNDNDLRFDPAASVAGQSRPDGSDDALTGFDTRLGTRRAPDSTAPGGPDSTNPQDPRAPEQPINAIDADGQPVDITPGEPPRPTGNRSIGFATGPLGRADAVWSGTLDNGPGEYRLNAGNELVAFNGPYPSATGAGTGNVDIGTALNVESDVDSITVLRWGRWSGGTANVDLGGGQADVIDLNNQSLHWVRGPESAAPPVMPITGSTSYTLLGNTSPTDSLGNVGVLGSATFDADFTNMRVDSTLVIDINAATWTAAGSGNLGAAAGLPAHLFSGNYAVTVGGQTGGTGVFSGFFSEPGPVQDPAFPGGVGLTYSLLDPQGATTVSGAAAFGNVFPPPVP